MNTLRLLLLPLLILTNHIKPNEPTLPVFFSTIATGTA